MPVNAKRRRNGMPISAAETPRIGLSKIAGRVRDRINDELGCVRL
jgi:hypothetical protein